MDWLGSVRDSDQDSEESKLVNDSIKNKLINLVNDAEEEGPSQTEESFELPFKLFRRPNTKSELRKSYVQRIVSTYLTNKAVPENSSNIEASKVEPVPSTSKRMYASSTPFYMSNARVAVEDSLFLSPINNIRRIPNNGPINQKEQESDSSPVKNTKEEPQAKRTKMPTSKTKTIKLKNKSMKMTGNIIKNTSKLNKEKSLKVNRTANSIVTMKEQSMTDRTTRGNIAKNILSKKKDLHTLTTLNPDRRRTFFNQSLVGQYDNVFELDEASQYCDVLPKPKISYLNDISYLVNSSPKQKIVILQNIQIRGPQLQSEVNDSVLPEHNENDNPEADTELATTSKTRRNKSNNRSKLQSNLGLHSLQKSTNDNEKRVLRNRKRVLEKSSSKEKNSSKEIRIVRTDKSIKMKRKSADKEINVSLPLGGMADNLSMNQNMVSPLTPSSNKKKRLATNLNNEFLKSLEKTQPVQYDKSKSRTGKINSSTERTIQDVSVHQSHVCEAAVFKRPRGRPKKAIPSNNENTEPTELKKPRGRPTKEPTELKKPRGRPTKEAGVFKRPRGRPKKAKPSNNANIDLDSIPKSSVEEANNNEFVKPTRPPPKKKHTISAQVGQDTFLRMTRLRKLAENVNNSTLKTTPLVLESPTSKKRKAIPRKLKLVQTDEGKSVQVESISTTKSNDLTDSVVTNTRTKSRLKKVSRQIETSLVTHDDASINMEQMEEEITSSTLKPSRNRCKPTFISAFYNQKIQQRKGSAKQNEISPGIVKIKEKIRKVNGYGRINFKTILEESQLQSERQNINLELENNEIDSNTGENSQTDYAQLKDSAIGTDSQDLDSTAPEKEGSFATTNSSVFVARENVHRHFIFDIAVDTPDNKSFVTQPLPNDADVRIGRIVIKPGFRKPNVTLKEYNLTIFVESGTGTFRLQNQTAQLRNRRFVKAYDGNEYSINNDGLKDLSLIYFTYPSKRI